MTCGPEEQAEMPAGWAHRKARARTKARMQDFVHTQLQSRRAAGLNPCPVLWRAPGCTACKAIFSRFKDGEGGLGTQAGNCSHILQPHSRHNSPTWKLFAKGQNNGEAVEIKRPLLDSLYGNQGALCSTAKGCCRRHASQRASRAGKGDLKPDVGIYTKVNLLACKTKFVRQ